MQLTNPRFLGGVLVLVWIGLLVYLALLDRLPSTLGTSSSAQSLGHFATHVVLSYLFLFNLTLWIAGGHRRLASAGLAVGGSLAVAALLETVQAFSASRDAAISDMIYSGAGAVLGAGIGLLIDWRLPYRWLWGIGGVLVLGPLTFTVLAMALWDTSAPRIGDHWHASYRITVCDTDVHPFGNTTGGVHTHSDSVIHVEPNSENEAGSNATLGLFIAYASGSLSENSLLLPNGDLYTNGDSCPGGDRGRIALWVNGTAVNPVASYVPQDGDEIRLTFEP